MTLGAWIRVAIGIAGLIACPLIIWNEMERQCVEWERPPLDFLCEEYGQVFNYQEAGMLAVVLMAVVISAYVLSRGLD